MDASLMFPEDYLANSKTFFEYWIAITCFRPRNK